MAGRPSTSRITSPEREFAAFFKLADCITQISLPLIACRPKYVHLTNEQFYEPEPAEVKDAIYDLSTSASSSTTNTTTTTQTALNRLMHDESAGKSHLENEAHHNGASTSKKSQKHSPLLHHHHHHQPHYTNSSNLVTVMMDEKSHDTEDHSFYLPLRRDAENGQLPLEFEGESRERP